MKKYFNIFKYACRVEFRKNSYVVFLVFCFLFLALVNRQTSKKAKQAVLGTIPQTEERYHLACPFTEAVYLPAEAGQYQENNNQLVVKKHQAQAIIIPHHLLAKDMINEALGKTISDDQTIILIGPNHFNSGREEIQTSLLSWKTRFGWLKPDQALISALALPNLVSIEQDSFYTEHSICSLVSFLKIHFPESKIIPLILKASVSKKQAKDLGQFLAQNCQDCLLVSSIDFSHQVSPYQAEINDKKSIEILSHLEEEKINEVACDSLPTLQVLFSYLQEKKVKKGTLIANSDANKITGENFDQVTSYVTMLFNN